MIYFISKQTRLFNDIGLVKTATLTECFNYIESISEVGVDTENSGLSPHTSYEYCFQIGDEFNQYIIDCLTIPYKEFQQLLEYEDKLYILQNAKYDLQFFYKNNIIIKGKIWDTYLAECRLTNGYMYTKKNLQALEEKYLDTDLVDKSLRNDIHTIPKLGYTDRVIKYSAGDIIVLPKIKKEQHKLAVKHDMLKIIALECEFVKALAYSEYCGIYLDKNKWTSIANANIIKERELEVIMENWVVDNSKKIPAINKFVDTQLSLFEAPAAKVLINWNSPKQLIDFFERLGVDCTIEEKGKTKKSTEAKLLKKQKDKSEFIDIYLQYASVSKEVSTYGLSFLDFINSKTGRIHPSYMQVLISGRLASGGDEQSNKAKNANIMVIPRKGGYRTCYTAQDPVTSILVNYDYSAMENVVFANKCKDPTHMEQIIKGVDQHSFVAKLAFKEELKDIPQDEVKTLAKEYRQDAKAVGFAILFGGSDFTIANNLGVSKTKAKEIYDAYFLGYPRMAEYFNECEEAAIRQGFILIDDKTGSKYFIDKHKSFISLHNKYSFDNKDYWTKYKTEKALKSEWFIKEKENMSYYFRWRGAIKRHSLNLPVQGTSSNILKIASIYLFNEILRRGWFNKVKIVLFLHDEYMCETPKELSIEVSKLMYDCMVKAASIYCVDVPLDATGGVTEVWEH